MIGLAILVALTGTYKVDGFSERIPAGVVYACESEVGEPYNWPDFTDEKWEHFTDCVNWRLQK